MLGNRYWSKPALSLTPTQDFTSAPLSASLYNGKEYETTEDLNWYFYGARWYDPAIGRFAGPSTHDSILWSHTLRNPVDPIAAQFAHVSEYNYAENMPVGHIDLWGLQAFMIHNTASSPERWTDNPSSVSTMLLISGNLSADTGFEWKDLSGYLNDENDRGKAAKNLKEYVMSNLSEGESVTLIGHSHGGNVAIQAASLIIDDLRASGDDRDVNLITIATPAYNSDDDPENPINSGVNSHMHFYNSMDSVQKGWANLAGSKDAGRKYNNPLTDNIGVFVEDIYTTVRSYRGYGGQKRESKSVDRIGAYSFDVDNPRILLDKSRQ